MRIPTTSTLALSAAAILVATSGCATRTKEVIYTPAAAPAPAVTVAPAVVAQPVIVASAEPPAPRVESQPPAPSPNDVWIPGYWNWSNGRYDWVAGHWERSHNGYTWVPYHWDMVNGQWQLTGGKWAPQ
jgi:hypothetical protein